MPAGEVVVRAFTGGPFAQNGYLVSCVGSGRAILVDPGAAVGEMLHAVEESALSVDAIVLTHAHIDHVDGVAEAKRVTGAPILLHPQDEPLYRSTSAQGEWFGLAVEPPPPVDRHLVPGEPVAFGGCVFEVRHTPGHAPGHVVLVGDGLALVGDVIFMGSIGRTDLPGGDFRTLMRSIREEVLTLPDETVLHPGHGPATTVGHERVSNPFLTQNLGGSSFA